MAKQKKLDSKRAGQDPASQAAESRVRGSQGLGNDGKPGTRTASSKSLREREL